MNDQELLRYSRQIMLPQIDISGQQTLLDTTMLLIGIGGLGSISAMYLSATGVGRLIIADFDKVEISNLQRQIIYNNEDIGKDKIMVAKERILAINPNIKVVVTKFLDENNLNFWVKKADIVLDGSDNFVSRFKINNACVEEKKPLISAAVIRFEGQLSVFKGYLKNKPCYQCLYSDDDSSDERCVDNGVLSSAAGVIGCLQATQAIKVALNLGEQLISRLLVVDLLNLSFRNIKISKDKNCKVCN